MITGPHPWRVILRWRNTSQVRKVWADRPEQALTAAIHAYQDSYGRTPDDYDVHAWSDDQ